MAYLAKYFMSGKPDVTVEEIRNHFDTLLSHPDFLGIKPGNPICLLFSSQEGAMAVLSEQLADPKVGPLIEESSVVTLESEGLSLDDFYDFEDVVRIRSAF